MQALKGEDFLWKRWYISTHTVMTMKWLSDGEKIDKTKESNLISIPDI